MVLVERSEITRKLLEKLAALAVGLEVFEALPGNVHGAIAGNEVADDALAPIALGEPLRKGVVAGGDGEIGDDAQAVQEQQAGIEIREPREVWAAGIGERF